MAAKKRATPRTPPRKRAAKKRAVKPSTRGEDLETVDHDDVDAERAHYDQESHADRWERIGEVGEVGEVGDLGTNHPPGVPRTERSDDVDLGEASH